MSARRDRPVLLVLGAAVLAACGDLVSSPDRVPAGVEFEQTIVTVTEGETIDLRPYVVDQDGVRFDRLPVWADFEWTASNRDVFDPANADRRALAPGHTLATAHIADLSGVATVRVNPVELEVAVPHAYLVQSVQRPDGSIPLVAGRGATLRIFVTGDIVNFFQPEAEVTFYDAGQELGRERVSLAGGGLPQSLNEGVFTGSWTVDVPAAWVQPGLSFVVTADPDGVMPAADRFALRFPKEGTRAVDVRVVPDLELRFVPIGQTRFGTVGSVSAATAPSWTRFLEDVFPVGGISRDVRTTFHTDAYSGAESDWYRIIDEIWALRILDDDDRYYYGVLRRNGGPAGLGYVGWPVAIGWDDMGVSGDDPIPLAYSTFAHEMGHNFGRWHAPACGPAAVDPDYPYPGGTAGVFGWHAELAEITRPSDPDLMGYCRPRWVSDYTYEGVLNFRIEEEEWRRRYHLEQDAGPGLLVWGSVRDGVVTLEPAISLDRARPTPATSGGLMVEGLDAQGTRIFQQPAATMQYSHGPAGSFAFSTAVPLASPDLERVHTIRVTGAGVVEDARQGRFSRAPAEARALAAGRARAFAAGRSRAGGTEVVWDAQRYPLLVVRDSGSGNVVAFARTGRLDLPGRPDRLTFALSDGVRSVRALPEAP